MSNNNNTKYIHSKNTKKNVPAHGVELGDALGNLGRAVDSTSTAQQEQTGDDGHTPREKVLNDIAPRQADTAHRLEGSHGVAKFASSFLRHGAPDALCLRRNLVPSPCSRERHRRREREQRRGNGGTRQAHAVDEVDIRAVAAVQDAVVHTHTLSANILAVPEK